MTIFFKISRNDKGATAIEFAFVAPLLILLVSAAVELGIIAYSQSVLDGAVDIGARKAQDLGWTLKLDPNTNLYVYDPAGNQKVLQLIKDTASGALDPSKLTVVTSLGGNAGSATITNTGTFTLPWDASTGNYHTGTVLFEVTYDWKFLNPFLALYFGGSGTKLYSSAMIDNEYF